MSDHFVMRTEIYPALAPEKFRFPVRLESKTAEALAVLLSLNGESLTEDELAARCNMDDGAVPVYRIRHQFGLTVQSDYVLVPSLDGGVSEIVRVSIPVDAAAAYLDRAPRLIERIRAARALLRDGGLARAKKRVAALVARQHQMPLALEVSHD